MTNRGTWRGPFASFAMCCRTKGSVVRRIEGVTWDNFSWSSHRQVMALQQELQPLRQLASEFGMTFGRAECAPSFLEAIQEVQHVPTNLRAWLEGLPALPTTISRLPDAPAETSAFIPQASDR